MNEESFIQMMQTLNSLTTSMESLTGTQNRILEVLEKEQVVESNNNTRNRSNTPLKIK